MRYVVGFGELCVFLLDCAQKIKVPYIPFTGCMLMDFLVIIKIFKIGIKWVVIRGTDECHGEGNTSLVLCFFVGVRLRPEKKGPTSQRL